MTFFLVPLVWGEPISPPREPGPGYAERPGEPIAAIDVRVLVGTETPYEGHALPDRLGNYSGLTAPDGIDLVARHACRLDPAPETPPSGCKPIASEARSTHTDPAR